MQFGGSNGVTPDGRHNSFSAPFHPASLIDSLTGNALLTGASPSLLAQPAMFAAAMPGLRSGTASLTAPSTGLLPALAWPMGAAQAPVSGFHINLIFDAAALAAPQSFRDGITAGAHMLEAVLSDNITVNLSIDYAGTGGGASAGPSGGSFEAYTALRSLLIAQASPGDHTFDVLPNSATIQGQSNVIVWNAQLKALGLLAGDNSALDGHATFATDIPDNSLIAAALHELTHAMGRVPYGPPGTGPQPDIFDFFRFTSAGNYLFEYGIPAPASYFSLDGGNTKLADYGVNYDAADFLNSGVQGSDDAFNEIYHPGTTLQDLTLVDLMQLVALGFHLVDIIAPDLSASGAALSGARLSATIGNIGHATAGASSTGFYLSSDSTITTADVLLGKVNTASLAAGDSVGKTLALAFSGAQAAGTYFVGAVADRADAVSESNEGNNGSNALRIVLGDNSANTLTGTVGDDHIFGLGGNDTIRVNTGNDSVDGGAGNDTIVYSASASFNAGDRIDGGADSDTLSLAGDYSAGVTFKATTLVNVENIVVAAGNNYRLTSHDATVAAGQSLTVDASALASGNTLNFDGSAETNGQFVLRGGAGGDSLTGGKGNDILNGNAGADILQPGAGDDTVNGGTGNDLIKFNATAEFGSADRINGGAGSDSVSLNGDYSSGVTFSATTLVNVEKIVLAAANSYSLTSDDATVAAGQSLTVDASALGAANKLIFNGAAESDGHFTFLAGLGADDLTGGALGDTFVYSSAAQSSGTAYDTIQGFNFANDRFDIPGTVAGIDAALDTGTLDAGVGFSTELNAALLGHFGANHAVLFTPDDGTLANRTFLVVDLNGNAAYDANVDLLFRLSGETGTLATSDFI